MAIQSIHHYWNCFQEQVENNWKVTTGAFLVATAVKVVWGKIASTLYVGSVVVGYIKYPDQIKKLNQLDLKGFGLASAVFSLPFLPSFISYTACSVISLSIVASEIQLSGIFQIANKSEQKFTALVNQGKEQIEELGRLVTGIQQKSAHPIALANRLIETPVSMQMQHDSLSDAATRLQKRFSEMKALLGTIQTAQMESAISVLEQRHAALNTQNNEILEMITAIRDEDKEKNDNLEKLLATVISK
jgi:cell division protein FtsL